MDPDRWNNNTIKSIAGSYPVNTVQCRTTVFCGYGDIPCAYSLSAPRRWLGKL